MDYENLQFECKGSTAYLTISRPKALNALNSEVFNELEACLTGLNTKALRLLVVQGAGDKAFVAGADIKEMSAFTTEQAREFSQKGQAVFALFEKLPLPVIAFVQGFALGGGLELALVCDILLLEQEAKIGLPEVTLGLFPSFGGTQRLERAVGFYKAKEMIFSGAIYSAQEAYNMGLAQTVLPKQQLIAKVEEYAKIFEKRGPLAIAKAKQLIQKGRDLSLEKALQQESKDFSLLFETKDSQEGMSAFIEKRKPQFKAE